MPSQANRTDQSAAGAREDLAAGVRPLPQRPERRGQQVGARREASRRTITQAPEYREGEGVAGNCLTNDQNWTVESPPAPPKLQHCVKSLYFSRREGLATRLVAWVGMDSCGRVLISAAGKPLLLRTS